MLCSRATCTLVRRHYLRPEARDAFVRALVDTYGWTRKRARSEASAMARALRIKEPVPHPE